MTLLLLDARWPTLVPVDVFHRLTKPLTFSDDVPEPVRAYFEEHVVDRTGGEGTHITLDPAEAQDHVDVIAVDSLNDPIDEARRIMSTARARGQWEAAQTHASLLPYLEEESGEFADAVRAGAAESELRKELGDVFLQVLFHAEIAAERGAFDLDDVAASFSKKMRSRAPYLFDGTDRVVSVDEQDELWAAGKRVERGEAS